MAFGLLNRSQSANLQVATGSVAAVTSSRAPGTEAGDGNATHPKKRADLPGDDINMY